MEPLQQEWIDKHLANTRQHIRLFRIAATALNAILDSDHRRWPGGRIPDTEIEQHDICKFSDEEVPHYARRFYGPNDDPEGWDGAWMHHLASTGHHWNSYVSGGVAAQMSRPMVAAMVADWLAAGRGYQHSWDMGEWLCGSIGGFQPRTKLHPVTATYLDSILQAIGYLTNLDNANLYGLGSRYFERLLIHLESGWPKTEDTTP